MMSFEMNQKLKMGLVFGSLLFTMACAKPPTKEMESAENAVNAAIQAGAEEYSSEQLKAAQDALAEANAKIDAKDYKGAKAIAMDAQGKAEAAAGSVEANKAQAKTDSEAKMTTLKPEIEGIQGAAAKVKGADAEQIKADATALKDQWTAIQADYDGGHFSMALDKLNNAQAKLDGLKSAIEAAKPAAKKK